MPRHVRIRLLIFTAVAIIAASVWLAGQTQRAAADDSARQIGAAQEMLVAMLDQETGLRGYGQTGRRVFLEPYRSGRRRFDRAFAQALAAVGEGDIEEREVIARQERVAREWQALAERANAAVAARGPKATTVSAALGRKALMDRFRAENTQLQSDFSRERKDEQRRAGYVSVALIIALSLLFGALGYLLIERGARTEARRRQRHAHFADVLQLSRTEAEAYDVVKRHLERTVPEARAIVLNRNNSADRLEPATPVPEGSRLGETLLDAEPESCLAIRVGAIHRECPEADDLLVCEVCGSEGSNSTCIPSPVGGEVIGSVLLQHPKPLGDRETRYLREAVAESAPIVANLRNLALAETRAATDLLTGLPNNRAAHDTLKRMVAQSDRTGAPLAAALFDLDHFKSVNDSYGHGKGDEVLAAVGDAVGSVMRASDFVSRYGGEEFLLLLPDTERDGAVLAAEKLRQAIASIKVSGVDRAITASFGVAVMPDDAHESTLLLRIADRALYSAKANGRDRVETPGPAPAPEPGADEPPAIRAAFAGVR